MKKTIFNYVPLLVGLLGFFVWHTPMRGPLTEAEITAFMAKQSQIGSDVWTNEEAFEDFLRKDDGHPFVMINLMEFRETAIYPEGLSPDTELTGEEAAALYSQSVLPQLLMRGSYPVALATRYDTIINSVGERAGEFESLAMVRYRSRRDLINMLSSDSFGAAKVHKWASLENTLVAPSIYRVSFNVIGYLPYFIIAFVLGGLTQRYFRA